MKRLYFYKQNILTAFLLLLFIFGCGQERTKIIPITTKSKEAKQEFIKGRDLFENLKFNQSLKLFESAVKKDTGFALAYYYLAQASPTAKEFYKYLNKAASLSNKISSGERRMILALEANADGNSAIAKDNLERLVKEYPDDERAIYLLGSFYYGQHLYQEAVDSLKKATTLAPNFSPAYNILGYSYMDMGNYPEAEIEFKKYTELVPNEPNPYDSYAELLMKEGKYDQSIEEYNKAISRDSNFVSSYIGISNDYNLLGKYDDARKELQILYNRAQNNGEKKAALFSTVVSYADEGNLNMALNEAIKLYKFDDNIKDTIGTINDLTTWGDILFEEGRYNDAMNLYNNALHSLTSSHLSYDIKRNTRNYIFYKTIRVLINKNDLDSARVKASIFSQNVKDVNNTDQIWLSYELDGLIALQEKDYGKAIEELKKANMQNPYIFYYIGMAYRGQRKYDLAKENFKEASDFNAVNNLNQAFVRKKALRMFSEM